MSPLTNKHQHCIWIYMGENIMNTKNWFRHLMPGAGIILATLLLTACGGGGGGDNGGGSGGGTTANTAPIANAGDDQTLRLGAGDVVLDGSASSDADGDSLSYTWEMLEQPGNSSASLTSVDSPTTSFTPDIDGTYRIQLTISDGADSATDIVEITVNDNTRPTANAGPNRHVVLGSGSVVIDGSGSSDPENDPLTYLWQIIQQPGSVSLGNTNGITTEFTPDVTGTYRVQLTVSDGILEHTVLVDIDVANNTLPTANAGPDQDVNRGDQITLDGSASTDLDAQGLSYTWTQLANQCPDVTGGSGVLTGVSPRFDAPAEVCTLVFNLQVNDGMGDSTADQVVIQVMEDKDNALFVAYYRGSDVFPGTRIQPMRTLQAAINAAETAGNGADIYVMQGTYAGTVNLADNISLYGGYDNNWERDRNRYISQIRGATPPISGNGADNLTIDGFTIGSYTNSNTYGLFLASATNVRVTNNVISAGNAGEGAAGANGRNGANGGRGGNGSTGSCNGAGVRTGGVGGIGVNRGGAGGNGGREGSNDGGRGGQGAGPYGGRGGYGGLGGNPGRRGGNGYAGRDGAAGVSASPAAQIGSFYSNLYSPSMGSGGRGGAAGSGGGGGGGGGGQGGALVNDGAGNGGGGGGGGGYGGTGGTGGRSGYGAFGIYLYAMTNTRIANNTITAGSGGRGGNGGVGGTGGAGGAGGLGATTCTREVGAGGNGGAGGRGGNGGRGGAGAGGPSIGIAYPAGSTSITLEGNTISVANPSSGGSPGGRAGISASTYQF